MKHQTTAPPPSVPLLSRRKAVQAIGGAFVAGWVIATSAHPAAAGRTWCKFDPVLKIDGQVVDIFVSSVVEMKRLATGPTKIIVELPYGSSGSVCAVDSGFGGWGYDIEFDVNQNLAKSDTHTQVDILVLQPAAEKSLPVIVEFTPRGVGVLERASAVTGTANKWIAIETV
jgi:hypothetical protein